MSMNENGGGKVGYYEVFVRCPTNPNRTPYEAECNDIIEALDMTFAEGEAFKAIWRKAAQRSLGVGKAGNTAERDAAKADFYTSRMVVQQHVPRMLRTAPTNRIEDGLQWDAPTEPGS